MTSQPGKQIIRIHILVNISKRNNNQTMAFGKLIELNIRNIFVEKLYVKCGGENIPRHLSKKIKFEDISRSIV